MAAPAATGLPQTAAGPSPSQNQSSSREVLKTSISVASYMAGVGFLVGIVSFWANADWAFHVTSISFSAIALCGIAAELTRKKEEKELEPNLKKCEVLSKILYVIGVIVVIGTTIAAYLDLDRVGLGCLDSYIELGPDLCFGAIITLVGAGFLHATRLRDEQVKFRKLHNIIDTKNPYHH